MNKCARVLVYSRTFEHFPSHSHAIDQSGYRRQEKRGSESIKDSDIS